MSTPARLSTVPKLAGQYIPIFAGMSRRPAKHVTCPLAINIRTRPEGVARSDDGGNKAWLVHARARNAHALDAALHWTATFENSIRSSKEC